MRLGEKVRGDTVATLNHRTWKKEVLRPKFILVVCTNISVVQVNNLRKVFAQEYAQKLEDEAERFRYSTANSSICIFIYLLLDLSALR